MTVKESKRLCEIANLDNLPEKEFTIIALPMKIKGGSGGPLRIIALLN